jgi:hypothetical protein
MSSLLFGCWMPPLLNPNPGVDPGVWTVYAWFFFLPVNGWLWCTMACWLGLGGGGGGGRLVFGSLGNVTPTYVLLAILYMFFLKATCWLMITSSVARVFT